MTSLLFSLVILGASVPEDPKLDGPLFIDRTLGHKVEVTLTETLTGYPTLPEKWFVIGPMPPSGDGQSVLQAEFYIPTEPQLRTGKTKDKGPLGQFFMSSTFASTPKPPTAQAIYQVQLYKRSLKSGVNPEKPFPLGATRLAYTASHPWLDMNTPQFNAWLKEEQLEKNLGETNIKYAWRIFKHIATFFTYDDEAEGLTPLATISNKKSNTLGLANLYLAILRKADIPSRFVVCRPLVEFKDQDWPIGDPRMDEATTDVLVEFWIDEIGWVPTDIVRAAGFHEPSELFGKMEDQFIALHYDMIQFEKGQYAFLDRIDWTRNAGVEQAKVKRKLEIRKL